MDEPVLTGIAADLQQYLHMIETGLTSSSRVPGLQSTELTIKVTLQGHVQVLADIAERVTGDGGHAIFAHLVGAEKQPTAVARQVEADQ